MESEKECQICGRKNGRNNFGAITCLPCAAFFRRSIVMELKFACSCVQNPYQAFGCKACRLERCFEAGMKKELVRAISLHSFHKNREKEMLEQRGKPTTHLQNSLILFSERNPFNGGFFKNLMEIGERTHQVWFSMASLPSEQLNKTLVELLESHANILAKNEDLNHSVQKFNKIEFLRSIETNGMAMEWHECPGRSSSIRSTLINISLLMALPAFQALDLQDQITQIKGAVGIANHLMKPIYSVQLSKEVMVLPNGIATIEMFVATNKFYGKIIDEHLAHKLYVRPMAMFANVGLDKLETILLIYILLCSPAVSTGLSSEAQLILMKESEKFGKALLQLQQQRFGEQAGALRYMESLRLIWAAVESKSIYQKILPVVDNVMHNGISRTYPRVIYALFEN